MSCIGGLDFWLVAMLPAAVLPADSKVARQGSTSAWLLTELGTHNWLQLC